ncbi:MAG: hypothetical protein U9R74_14105 [Pseudomonadota bacterium]|nr:hypothetical protein [Pseudomonadota bacterium]
MNDYSGQNGESYALSDRNWDLLLDHYWRHVPGGARPRPPKLHRGQTKSALAIEQVHSAVDLWLSWHGLIIQRNEPR